MAPGAQQTEPLSTWSLILGILSFVFCPVVAAIPAIITGVKAKKAIDSSGGTKSGRSSATAGVILGIANVAVSALAITLLVVLIALAHKHTQYTDLQAGECYNRVNNSLLNFEVDRVDCLKPHNTEVTGSFEATDPGSFPGSDGFRTQADPKCSALGTEYLGSNSGSGLRIVWLTPGRSVWDNGTHTVVCGLQNADGSRHTGSVRG